MNNKDAEVIEKENSDEAKKDENNENTNGTESPIKKDESPKKKPSSPIAVKPAKLSPKIGKIFK